MLGDHATRKTPSRRTAVWAAAAGAAALLAAATALHPATASAGTGAPAGPAGAALAGPGLGSGSLIQSGDFYQQGLAPVRATVGLTGAQALSACSGEETMRDLTGAGVAGYAEVTWYFDTSGSLLTESLAAGSGGTAAAGYEKKLKALVRGCQDEPAGHWYYGKAHALTLPAGHATWYPAYDGDGTASGGVAVVRAGARVGVLEVTGQPTDDPGYVQGLAAAAVDRLPS
jgi:hypothetical protein